MRLIVFFAFLFVSIQAQSQDTWTQANKSYEEQEYQKAIELYETMVEEDMHSYELYYNLGGAYFKLNRFAESILNYEKALLLKSGDDDTKHNLSKAKSKIKDKAELVTKFDSPYLMKGMSEYLSPFAFQLISLISLISFIIFAMLRKLKNKVVRPVWLIITILFSFSFFAFSKWQEKESKQYLEAIVFSPRVNVKSSPTTSGTGIFVLHEGVKVRVLDEREEWLRIYLDSEKIGWLKSSDVEKISI